MRRLLSLLLAAALLTLCGCGTAAPAPDGGRLSVVVTIFPMYDWLMNVLGSHAVDADITLLMGSGVDMHSFQPSAADIVKVSSCDLFIYVGGESDTWTEDALAEAVNPDMVALDLLDILGGDAREEELAEGMQPEEEAEEDGAYDEHVWLSLKNAARFCQAIADALASLDPDHGADYAANAAAYIGQLHDLDGRYQDTVDAASLDTLLFGDRFPFLYLTEDYGLRYYAAFPGCSAETEASFETIAFLSGKLEELGLPAVLIIDGSDGRVADTIAKSAGAGGVSVLTLDSMQSATDDDIDAGKTYLGTMEQNLAVLDTALNG